jgi:hypothetical protein
VPRGIVRIEICSIFVAALDRHPKLAFHHFLMWIVADAMNFLLEPFFFGI